MATKRTHDAVDIVPVKILKISNEHYDDSEDVLLDCSELSDDLKCSLEYDAILKMFVIGLEKKLKEEKRWIRFGEKENDCIIRLLPTLVKLSSRYSSKRSPQPLDISFEMSQSSVGERLTVMSLKENMFKRGNFDVDIRKCIKKEDNNYQYTTEGVRFTQKLIPEFEELLRQYQSKISSVYQETYEILKIAMAHIVIREIQELAGVKQNCHGCQINHSSQKQHMGPGGCLSTEQAEWSDIVEQFWSPARRLVDEVEVQISAKQAVLQLPVFQVLFYVSNKTV